MKTASIILSGFLLTATIWAGEMVSWTPNPPSDAVTQYRVCWSTNMLAPKPWTTIALVSTNNAPGSTNTVGRNYYYVTALNAYGESDPSDVAFRPAAPDKPKVEK